MSQAQPIAAATDQDAETAGRRRKEIAEDVAKSEADLATGTFVLPLTP